MRTFRGANPFDQLSPAVRWLIMANGVVFMLQFLAPTALLELFALRPEEVLTRFRVWQLGTYAFLHGNFWHLFFNLFALWMFGAHVERAMGTRPFLRYYFICVLGAAIAQTIIAPESVVVGASGGIYGILLAFGFLFPDAVIYLFFIFPLRAIQAVFFIALLTLVAAIGSGGSKVAHFAHMGGLVTGLLMFKFPGWWENVRMWRMSRLFSRPRGRRPTDRSAVPPDLRHEVDRILDKISRDGVDSLTSEEHETMREYAKKKS